MDEVAAPEAGGDRPALRADGGSVPEVIEFTAAADNLLDQLYREVLQPAFPPAELVSLEEFRDSRRQSPETCPGLLVLRDGVSVGGILGEVFPRSRVLLVSYLAVRESERGTGLGGVLLTEALSRWPAATHPATVLAEVEDPRFHRDGTDGSESPYGDPVRRLLFYERHGARVLPMPYIQPALRPEVPRVRGLLLICFDDRQSVPGGLLTDFLDEYFEGCEGSEVVRTDPEYRALRRRYEVGDHIALWPLRRAPEVPAMVVDAGGWQP